MGWSDFVVGAFNKPGSRHIRLALSLLFISLMTAIIMTIFTAAKVILHADLTLWETHTYTILFTSVMAPFIALFVLLRFEKLYGKIAKENMERERAEEALRESEEMLWHIFDSSPVPMVLYNESKGRYHYNKRFTETFGYTIEDIPSINEWWLLAYPDVKYREFVKKRWYAAVDDAVKNRTSIEPQEAVLTCKDGSKKDILGNFSSIGDLNLVVFYDITERKQAEEALRESEERYRSLFEHMLNGFAYCKMLYDDQGNPEDFIYLAVNTAFGRFTGLENVVGKRATEVIPWIKESRPELLEIYGRVAATGKPEQFENEFKPLAAWLSVSVYSTGQGYFTAIFDNITERKRAEEALRESEAMLNSIFRSAPTGIGVVVDRVIIEVNDRLCGMTGYSREELLGKNARVFYPSGEEYEHVGKVKYGLIEEGGTGEVETRWRRKDGTLINILLSSAPIVPGNLSAGVTFTALDITKRKRAEKELKVEKQQAELYLDLMGHDINNMHQIILGYLELARDMNPEAGQSEFLNKPIEVLQRSAQLIRNVRKLQKLREGMFQTQVVDVCQLLLDVQREFGAVPHKAVTMNLDGCKQCQVHANEMLHDVFANLLGNAIKHTGERADIIVVLDVVWDDGRQYCRVMVEDDGPGIPDDFKGRIFNRMIESTDKTKGMGLGLYLVKSLVESYGGRVSVEDRVQGDHTKGARFVVMLPAVVK